MCRICSTVEAYKQRKTQGYKRTFLSKQIQPATEKDECSNFVL